MKTKVRNIPLSRLEWLYSKTQRQKLPASYFLLPEKRLFPFRNKDGTINCNMLRAAIVRAAQHGYKEVERKARRLYQRYCKGHP
ncbi:MAG: hypothetical protein DSY42_00460 [Aquifex sp.]|nr:MAG: hypothetical protein DSY42_00460 [Aquifex sp.]